MTKLLGFAEQQTFPAFHFSDGTNNSTRASLEWTFSYIYCISIHADLDLPLVAIGCWKVVKVKRRESLVIKTVFVPYALYDVDNRNNIMGDKWNFSVNL